MINDKNEFHSHPMFSIPMIHILSPVLCSVFVQSICNIGHSAHIASYLKVIIIHYKVTVKIFK